VYKHLKGGCKEDGTRVFSVVSRDLTKGNEHKPKYRSFPLNTKKHVFTVSMIEHWHRVPREVVESPSLELLKSHLDVVPGPLALGGPV